jgi:hypothetical protein
MQKKEQKVYIGSNDDWARYVADLTPERIDNEPLRLFMAVEDADGNLCLFLYRDPLKISLEEAMTPIQ